MEYFRQFSITLAVKVNGFVLVFLSNVHEFMTWFCLNYMN